VNALCFGDSLGVLSERTEGSTIELIYLAMRTQEGMYFGYAEGDLAS
jgi:hypothetical protein